MRYLIAYITLMFITALLPQGGLEAKVHKGKCTSTQETLSPFFGFPVPPKETNAYTPYLSLCARAAENEDVFNHFKRDDACRAVSEYASHELGEEYLNFIIRDYPDLVPHFDVFRSSDALGDPVTYDYGKYGKFSPTTLHYIKVAGDLRKQFGDLSQMRIVEIGGHHGEQCKILADLCGFASYTIIDFPECNTLSRKCLELHGIKNVSLIDSDSLEWVGTYDLVISHFTFSERMQPQACVGLNSIITPTPRGYITLSDTACRLPRALSDLDEVVAALYNQGYKGKVERERLIHNVGYSLLTWQSPSILVPAPLENQNRILSPCCAVTYEGGDRLGDILQLYLHAKWISYKYKIPLLYTPFKYAEGFAFHEFEWRAADFPPFDHVHEIWAETDVVTAPVSSLCVIPFFVESPVYWRRFPHLFQVDWTDPGFREEMLRCICPNPKTPIATLSLPTDRVTIGVHLRRGDGYDGGSTQTAHQLKFPPDSFYVEQIRRILDMFEHKKFYIFIFTDSINPHKIVLKYRNIFKNKDIEFACHPEMKTAAAGGVLEDFFSITKFDCLVLPCSGFSWVASILSPHAFVTMPIHNQTVNGKVDIDEVETEFDGSVCPPLTQ